MKVSLLVKLGAGIVVSVLVLGFLMLNARSVYSGKNGFDRNKLAVLTASYTGKDSITAQGICGMDGRKIFLNVKNEPRIIYAFDYREHTMDTILLKLPVNSTILSAYDMVMDSTGGTLFSGNYGASFHCPIQATDSTEVVYTRYKVPLFMRSAIISDTRVTLRAFDTSSRFLQFAKADRQTGDIIATADVFDRVADGGFSTDGELRFDHSGNRIYYMQLYRNRFVCLDTNLNVIYEARTIDTTNTNPVFTRSTGKDGTGNIMPTVPLRQVNSMLWVDNDLIYIVRVLQADNENDNDFNANTAVDVYTGHKGTYRGTIYVPNVDRHKLTSFQVKGDNLIAFYRHRLAVYPIEPEQWKGTGN